MSIARCKDNEAFADMLNNLGNIHKSTGEHRDAMKCYHKALHIRKNFMGHDFEKVADSYLDCYKETLWIRTAKLGNDSPRSPPSTTTSESPISSSKTTRSPRAISSRSCTSSD